MKADKNDEDHTLKDLIIRMKKEGKTFEDVCNIIAKNIGYDDTVSYGDIADMVEKIWNKIDSNN